MTFGQISEHYSLQLGFRTLAIERKLRDVEKLPATGEPLELTGLVTLDEDADRKAG